MHDPLKGHFWLPNPNSIRIFTEWRLFSVLVKGTLCCKSKSSCFKSRQRDEAWVARSLHCNSQPVQHLFNILAPARIVSLNSGVSPLTTVWLKQLMARSLCLRCATFLMSQDWLDLGALIESLVHRSARWTFPVAQPQPSFLQRNSSQRTRIILYQFIVLPLPFCCARRFPQHPPSAYIIENDKDGIPVIWKQMVRFFWIFITIKNNISCTNLAIRPEASKVLKHSF